MDIKTKLMLCKLGNMEMESSNKMIDGRDTTFIYPCLAIIYDYKIVDNIGWVAYSWIRHSDHLFLGVYDEIEDKVKTSYKRWDELDKVIKDYKH